MVLNQKLTMRKRDADGRRGLEACTWCPGLSGEGTVGDTWAPEPGDVRPQDEGPLPGEGLIRAGLRRGERTQQAELWRAAPH